MAHYVDIDTSVEDLEEEKALTAAVEEFAKQAAVSVWTQVITEIQDNVLYARDSIEWYLPILVVYREERHVLWEHLQALGFFILMVLWACFCLAPMSPRRRRKRSAARRNSSFSWIPSSPAPPLQPQQTTKSCTLYSHLHHYPRLLQGCHGIDDGVIGGSLGRAAAKRLALESSAWAEQQQQQQMQSPTDTPNEPLSPQSSYLTEEETDEERFAQAYPALMEEARYAKLLLPPTCQRVATAPRKQQQQQMRKKQHKSNPHPNNNSNSSSTKPEDKKQPNNNNNNSNNETNTTTATTNTNADDDQDDNETASATSTPPPTPEVRDNPALRLDTYARQAYQLFRAMIYFDYASAGWTVVQWLLGIWRHRRSKRKNEEEAQAEEDNNNNPPRNAETQQAHDPASTLNSQSADAAEQHDKDDDTDATSGVETTTTVDEDHNGTVQNAASVSSSIIRDADSPPENDSPKQQQQQQDQNTAQHQRHPSLESLPPADTTTATAKDNDDDLFHTPTHNLRRKFCKTSSANENMDVNLSDAPPLPLQPQDDDDNEKRERTVAGRIAGILKPRLSATRSQTLSVDSGASNKNTFSQKQSASDPSLLSEGESAQQQAITISQSQQNNAAESSRDSTKIIKSTAESPFRKGFRHFFEAADTHANLQKMSAAVPVPDKNGYILGDEFLPDASQQTPLLVFVNSRSGPQQGQLLITQLRRLLNPIQVWDLADGGPEPILESFCVLTRLRILVCGGDGSVSWIISALEKLKLKRKWPPIAILPLGTGNDLARVMGWGGGYNNESLIGILEQISESYISLLDRWEMTVVDRNGKATTSTVNPTSSSATSSGNSNSSSSSGKVKHKTFFNYFGVGADAEAALQVHYLRESRPEWFFSRLVNKAWYGVFGAEDIIKNTSTSLHKDITLYADGVEVPLPRDSQGIIILNIDSYAGGIPIWSHGWRNPEHSDRVRNFPHHGPRRANSVHEMGHDDYPLRRSSSMGHRLDSSEDLLGLLTEEERYDSVTACDLPASCQDGILEVVSIRSLFHLGQIRVGLSNAQRLCQCRHIKIVTRKKVAFQTDGEPWRQDQCVVEIRRKQDPALMLHRSLDDGGAETEMSKLLEWAEERELIDGRVHRILMKEFSRRIESKTQQRRRRPNGNHGGTQGGGVLHNLSRAIGSSSSSALANSSMSHAQSQPNLASQYGQGHGISF